MTEPKPEIPYGSRARAGNSDMPVIEKGQTMKTSRKIAEAAKRLGVDSVSGWKKRRAV